MAAQWYEVCIECSEPEYDSCEDICYNCGYQEEPKEEDNGSQAS